MDKWANKVAVVTGASSGMGAAIASALVHHGMTVVGLARREEKVKELAAELVKAKKTGKLYSKKVDLRKEEDILAAFSWVDKELGGADVLVNTAGLNSPNHLVNGITEEWRAVLETNILAVTIATREFLKSMERRNNQQGHVFIINSIAGHLAENPKSGLYAGSKHAIKAVAMCLRRELAEKNSTIKVTNVSPGLTDTEFFNNYGQAHVEKIRSLPILQGSDVAQVIVNALSTSDVCELCEVVLNPVPTKVAVY